MAAAGVETAGGPGWGRACGRGVPGTRVREPDRQGDSRWETGGQTDLQAEAEKHDPGWRGEGERRLPPQHVGVGAGSSRNHGVIKGTQKPSRRP